MFPLQKQCKVYFYFCSIVFGSDVLLPKTVMLWTAKKKKRRKKKKEAALFFFPFISRHVHIFYSKNSSCISTINM